MYVFRFASREIDVQVELAKDLEHGEQGDVDGPIEELRGLGEKYDGFVVNESGVKDIGVFVMRSGIGMLPECAIRDLYLERDVGSAHFPGQEIKANAIRVVKC